jgi:putative endonuclease
MQILYKNNMATHNEKGKIGEKLAKEYLINQGYKILHVNWRIRRYEVDIIAQKNDTLVFCEVKYRSYNTFGEPESFVTKEKQRNIIKAAAAYIGLKRWLGESCFDIIGILMEGGKPIINHIENAYRSTW